MKAIISLQYPSRNRPAKYGDFQWSHEQGCYIWKGRIFDLTKELADFHACADKVLGIADCFPRPSVRILDVASPVAVDLTNVPVEQLIEATHLRARDIKVFQLAKARSAKKAKNQPPVLAIDLEKERMEGEGGIAVEPALAG